MFFQNIKIPLAWPVPKDTTQASQPKPTLSQACIGWGYQYHILVLVHYSKTYHVIHKIARLGSLVPFKKRGRLVFSCGYALIQSNIDYLTIVAKPERNDWVSVLAPALSSELNAPALEPLLQKPPRRTQGDEAIK